MATPEIHADNNERLGTLAGVVAQFETPAALLTAAERVREAGFRRWDAYSPLPVHGLDRAMGIRMTILPWIVMGAGVTGGVVGLLMQWWTNAVHYPIIVSGKPLFSVPANIPVTFEMIVLFSALTTFFGALALSLLPQYWDALFTTRAFARATTDAFLISIDARDYKFDEAAVRGLLQSLGAQSVETYYEPARGQRIPGFLYWLLAVVLVLAPLPPLAIAWQRATPKSLPRVQILKDMDSQPKYKAQGDSPLFLDGRSDRPPVAHSIARGRLDSDGHFSQGKLGDQWARTFPQSVELSPATMNRGRERFNIYCAPCHGLAGDGDGMTAMRAQRRGEINWVPPLQLNAPSVRAQPVGQLFHSITNGVRKMPALWFADHAGGPLGDCPLRAGAPTQPVGQCRRTCRTTCARSCRSLPENGPPGTVRV